MNSCFLYYINPCGHVALIFRNEVKKWSMNCLEAFSFTIDTCILLLMTCWQEACPLSAFADLLALESRSKRRSKRPGLVACSHCKRS